MKTKSIYLLIFCASVAAYSCKKDMQQTKLSYSNASNDTQTDGPVKNPTLVLSATMKSQFVANANGNGSSDFTMNFSSQEAGITIESLAFIAYAADSTDALSISIGDNGFPGFFQPTGFYGSAKAITHIDGTDIKLPDDGSNVAVTFHVMYRSPLTNGIKSGDTVSIQVAALDYINLTSPYLLYESVASDISPKMVITGAKPLLEVMNDVDILHKGLTKIFTVNCSSDGGRIAINNLPLDIDATGAKFLKDLIIKDERHHIIPALTIRDNNKYTIRFPKAYLVDEGSPHTFYIYAPVYKADGGASVKVHLQQAENFSWTDIEGGRTTPYTIENEMYFYNYPSTTTIISHK
ncbi:MAG: hypothetical protein ABJB05_04975 [Parafilimonas sp.]